MQVTDEMVRVALEKFWEAWPWFRDTYTELKNERGNPLTLSDLPPEPMEAALTAALAAMWQPIETAPEHGDILIFVPHAGGGNIWIGQRDFETENWFDASGATICSLNEPTHWMPLPPAPSQLSKRDDAERDSPQEA